MSAERVRLEESARREKHWKRWGPYLSERQWATVREDYSARGDAWGYFPHDHARSRAYRWGEDGIAGISDNHQRLCFAVALWNGRDPILKERLFGLTADEGNHAEDVKEYYYYLDATPTHSWMKCLYKYPQAEFPYERLLTESLRRDRSQPEFELIDTGVFDQDRYFDVFVEYAKADVDDIVIRITAVNRGPDRATLHVLPSLWFRNTWGWGYGTPKPRLRLAGDQGIEAEEATLGRYALWFDQPCAFLFTENESNTERLWGYASGNRFYKDAFHGRVVRGRTEAVNPAQTGTKACGWYILDLAAGESRALRLRLSSAAGAVENRGEPARFPTRDAALIPAENQETRRLSPVFASAADLDAVLACRQREADEFYAFIPRQLSADARAVERQALAGLLWSKQFYHYVVETWLNGDPACPPPSRKEVRNYDWPHIYNEDIVSMPDKWEYPWYAAWDLAFHMIPFALLDAEFAKHQLALFLRECYMHPNGQLPAYEWNFSDVNPPVHAWACWRVYKIDRKLAGRPDYDFLEGVFHKLLMNFTWWVNRKDSEGNNIFEGGFLGLDNVGLFDRSKPLPVAGLIEQSDGTSWMAMYCLNMLRIAIELSLRDRVYEDIASKFFEHFLHIASAMNRIGGGGLWDETDGFYYDRLRLADGRDFCLKVRSMVGLIPLFAADTLEPFVIDKLPGFKKRLEWFLHHRPDLCCSIASMTRQGQQERRLLAMVPRERLARLLNTMLDEREFLSPHGIRSLSRCHLEHPFVLRLDGEEHSVDYEPAESTTFLFGGNSNWRGPVWFPVNYLIIESLQKFHHYFGDSFLVEFPTGSGRRMTLGTVAAELSRRLVRLFLRGKDGRRAVFGGAEKFQTDPHFRDYILFYEYFHGDNGAGIGASHQTGWTGLVAKLIQQSGE